jgi:DNA-binding transcriptional ArsR family regulator
MEVKMKESIKIQPAGGGRAANDGLGAADDVDSAINHSDCNTEADPCQGATSDESFRAAMPQHISNKLAEVVRNVEKRAKGDGTGEPENGAFGEACQYGRPIACTEVYVKIKVAFRQKALRLLKGAKLSCFICIGLHIDEKGECYPSIDTIVRETGYSRPTVCSALDELVELGFIEKTRRKGETTLYLVKGYIWYGSESKPTLLGEAQSKETLLSPSESKASERLPTKRLATLPKDEPSVKEQPLEKKEREISNSKPPSPSFSTENNFDEDVPESPLIVFTVDKLSRTFKDLHHLSSNITRARRLWWHKTDLEEKGFVEVMEKAAAITKQKIGKSNIRKSKMAYFFAVLEDKLGLRGKKWSAQSEPGG